MSKRESKRVDVGAAIEGQENDLTRRVEVTGRSREDWRPGALTMPPGVYVRMHPSKAHLLGEGDEVVVHGTFSAGSDSRHGTSPVTFLVEGTASSSGLERSLEWISGRQFPITSTLEASDINLGGKKRITLGATMGRQPSRYDGKHREIIDVSRTWPNSPTANEMRGTTLGVCRAGSGTLGEMISPPEDEAGRSRKSGGGHHNVQVISEEVFVSGMPNLTGAGFCEEKDQSICMARCAGRDPQSLSAWTLCARLVGFGGNDKVRKRCGMLEKSSQAGTKSLTGAGTTTLSIAEHTTAYMFADYQKEISGTGERGNADGDVAYWWAGTYRPRKGEKRWRDWSQGRQIVGTGTFSVESKNK
ncbi:hypothetical protein F5148DRAFT_1149442 [Russula earlei]|uniref:Uncharacterized protein n=1 Tax=Russula earlei TaxID=71964 RepID=A0ACC0U8R3_9AGAM|nr:hypothetical protein F5148DRAFT_1149442 [Russula earlei]